MSTVWPPSWVGRVRRDVAILPDPIIPDPLAAIGLTENSAKYIQISLLGFPDDLIELLWLSVNLAVKHCETKLFFLDHENLNLA